MLSVHDGSILDVKADAIVNPANSFLRHTGGLARVIDQAAKALPNRQTTDGNVYREYGKIIRWVNDHDAAPLIATGDVHVTSAGRLPFDGVIHAVGPIWGGGDFMERDLLEIVMGSVIDAAMSHGWKTIAVPAISCGVFGFPVEDAARILTTVASWSAWPYTDVIFAVMGDHVSVFKSAIQEVQ